MSRPLPLRPLLLSIVLLATSVVSHAVVSDAQESEPMRLGIIGLDTSHVLAFTKILNDENAPPELSGFRVVAAYPKGSPDIESSTVRVPQYTIDIQKYGVKIVDSIDALVEQVDAVLLETNDGRPHLEQVRPVLKAGKPVFIDKPVAGSLKDAIAIYREAKIAGVPLFSSSSLRFGANSQAARAGALGTISRAETHSPASLEATHPDLFWYGIHGVESLFTVMGTGCESVQRSTEDGKIVVTGKWAGGRVGIFREGSGYGGTATGSKGEGPIGSSNGYPPLVVEIVKFLRTGKPPVSAEETLEIYAFMEAADESKRQGGKEVTLASVMQEAGGFTSLFNGKDLAGWKGLVGNPKSRAAMSPEDLAKAQAAADELMRAHWSVADNGDLIFDGKGQSLCTVKDYGDFEMYLDWKILEGGDSGIYLRGSPQLQIWDTEFPRYFPLGAEKGSGAPWNNQKNPRFPSAKGDKPFGNWNTFYIRMVGERIIVKLNGVLVVDNVVLENYWDRKMPIFAREQIELQNHGNTLYFRNLFLREIPSDEANGIIASVDNEGFEPVFNGKDFTGLKGDVDNYEIVDGAVRCKAGQGGNLFTEKQYGDFIARLEFQLPPGGNNGLAMRYAGEGQPHIEGFELQVLDSEHEKYAELDPRQYHGSVYGLIPAHRGYLRPTGEWNFQQVTMVGSKIKVELNGTTILEGDIAQVKEGKDGAIPAGALRKTGHFGFAGHNDPVAFRNVSIRELPGEPVPPPSRTSALAPEDRIQLFNGKNLDGMYSYIEGTAYADSNKVFTVQDGLLHVSGNGYGGLITNEAYRDYHLIIEFKWDGKTWGNRVDRARDSGLLLHCWGPDGGYGNKWMASIEAQIIEGGVGDILVLTGTHPTTGQKYMTELTADITKDRDGEKVWKKGGEPITLNAGRINWFGRDPDWADTIGFRGKDDVESPLDEWTKMEVIADGDRLLYKVNGVVVNEAYAAKPDSGKILLQTEQAGLLVRKLELWPIGKAP